MRSARTMAAFATRVFGFLCTCGDALKVGILIEPEPHIWMACLANHAADVGVARGRLHVAIVRE